MTYRTIGRCSICGGDVTVFSGAWGSIIPPVPRCTHCGARPQTTLPIIPMERPYTRTSPSTTPFYYVEEETYETPDKKSD